MPEITNVRFSCGNSNIRDLLQILATEIQTNFNNSPQTECPQIMLKSEKNMSPKQPKKIQGAIERPATSQSFGRVS
jgi:hypothetical protein